MSVRLIAGRAGSGKTHWCQRRICEQLGQSIADGPSLVMLVPEQAALQMERGLLAMAASPVLGRCEVLSFRRLAHRILNETTGPMPAVLSASGRQAALRRLLARRRGQLREFDRMADRAGFISAVSRSVTELLQEAATVDQLDAAAARAQSDGDPSARRLHDLAMVYRDYLDYLGSERVDPEGVLDLARQRLERSDWLTGAMVWVDGFAGLMRQQVRMLVTLAARASQMDIALLLDPARERQWSAAEPVDDLSLFARTERTWQAVRSAMMETGVAIEPPVLLSPDDLPRFTSSPALGRLERSLFAGRGAEGSTAAASSPPAARMVSAADRRVEVQAAVKAVVDLVQAEGRPLRYRDIAIIVRDLEPYHDLLSAALAEHGVPFFMDRRRPLHPHALVRLIREGLSLHLPQGFGAAAVGMVKTGLTRLADEEADALENYVLLHGLSGIETWREAWTFSPRAGGGRDEEDLRRDDAANLARLDALRASLLEWIGDWGPTAGAAAHPRTSTWLTRLWGMLERLGVAQGLASWRDAAAARGDHGAVAEHEQAWKSVVRLLDELADALGDEQMTARQFRECVEAGLSGFTLALAPSTVDQVLVSAVERSRHPPVRAAFVLGLCEGDFPARISDEDVLGDDERAALSRAGLELTASSQRRSLDERMLAYIALTRAGERLFVSFPRSDERGRPLRASPFWGEIRRSLPGVIEEQVDAFAAADVSSRQELAGGVAGAVRSHCETAGLPQTSGSQAEWLALYAWGRAEASIRGSMARGLAGLRPAIEARLGAEAAAALWRAPHKTNVYALETFAACPFRHFAGRGLGLAPRAEHDVLPTDLGNIYHQVMEEFVEGLRAGGKRLADLTTGQVSDRVSHLCEQAVQRFAEQVRLEERQQRLAVWRGRRELPAAVEGQKRSVGQTALSPARLEQAFGLSKRASPGEGGAGGVTRPDPLPALELTLKNGATVLLRGVIDRIDLVQSGRETIGVVYDYKRSVHTRRLALDRLWHGLSLQLAAYLLVLKDHGEKIAGARVIPGGAFYLPLIASPRSVDSAADADAPDFNAFADFGPRGVIDFDWISTLDAGLSGGWSQAFRVYVKKRSAEDKPVEPGFVEASDAATTGTMEPLLEYVRAKMTELCEAWLAGDVAVSPAILGTWSPCAHCDYKPVCRIEQPGRAGRRLPPMKRSHVLRNLSGDEPATRPDGARGERR